MTSTPSTSRNWTFAGIDLAGICVGTQHPRDDESVILQWNSNGSATHENTSFFDNARARVQAMILGNKDIMGVEATQLGSTNDQNDNEKTSAQFIKTTNDTKYYATDSDTDEENGGGTIKAKIFMISGCEDSQTSADVSNVSSFSLPDPNGRAGGACTSALLKVLYSNPSSSLTFVQVLKKMRAVLKNGRYSQIPQLTSSFPLSTSDNFYLIDPDCTGTKRAVLIGINYKGQEGQLSGCHNDVGNMKDYLLQHCGLEENNITVLLDDNIHTSPTRTNILDAYKNLAASSKSGDAVFCHFSGHGGRIRDDGIDEADGYDETLVPVDYNQSGQIRDDDLLDTLVKRMPLGVSVVSLMDCCHSGTVLDLPYKYGGKLFTSTRRGGCLTSPFACCNNCLTMLCCIIFLIVIIPAVVLPLFFTQDW